MKQIGEVLSQIANKEPALPASKPSGDGKSFQVAVRDVQICNLKNMEPLKQALRYVMLLVGLRANNFPDHEEKQVIMNYIQKYYGGHTAAEIKLAFEMAIAGKLEVEQVSCFENFTTLYFSSIMNAYRSWAKQESFYIEREKQDPVQKVYTIDELENIQRGDIEAFYQRCLNGVVPPDILPEYFKEVLVKDNLISAESNDLHAFFSYHLNKGTAFIYKKQ